MGNWLDIAILAAALPAGYLGWRIGGMRILATVSGAVAGGLLALQYYQYMAIRFSWLVSTREAAEIISFMAIALGVCIVTVLLGLIARRLVHFLFLGWLDGGLGCVASIWLAFALGVFGLVTLSSLTGADVNGLLGQSYAARFMVDSGPSMVGLLPEPISSYLESTFARSQLSVVIQMPH